MEMETHKCKLCTRSFSNGRALGGHMRSHLAPLPIHPKQQMIMQLTDQTESSSLSSSEEEEEEERESEEIPKKSFRWVDSDEFLNGGGRVVHDRESESEPNRNPTRKRSKRITRKTGGGEDGKHSSLMRKPSSTESVVELETVSSVSDTTPEEDVALCLMMLSRDVWGSYDLKTSQTRFKNYSELELEDDPHRKKVQKKVHECSFCFKVFASGQALGGHKRSHFIGSSTTSSSTSKSKKNSQKESSAKNGDFLIDLNLPAPMEDEDFIPLEEVSDS